MEDARKLKSIGHYLLHDIIGEGSFSVVKKATISGSNETYACKIIPKTKFKERNLAKRFQLEIRVLQTLHHPNIIQIHDIFRNKQYYCVIMEYIGGGTLFDYIADNRGISEEDSKNFMYQIFKAMKYVHDIGVSHRDLKLENILLNESHDSIKISDFGLSRFLDANGLAKTPVGSPMYASPECLSGQPYDGRKSDIWSCGVIMYAMLTGKMPWFGKTQSHIFNQIKNANYEMPSYLSSHCRKLIRSILTPDLQNRPSDSEILNSEWLSTNKKRTPDFPMQSKPYKLLSLKSLDCFFQKDIKSRINSASFENLLISIHNNEKILLPKSIQTISLNSNDNTKSNIPLKKVPSTTLFEVDFEKALHSIFVEKIDSTKNCTSLPHFKKRTSKNKQKRHNHSHRPNSLRQNHLKRNNSIIIKNENEPIDPNICNVKTQPIKNRCSSHIFINVPDLSQNQFSTSDNFTEDNISMESSPRDDFQNNSNNKLVTENEITDKANSDENQSHTKKSKHKSKKEKKLKKDKSSNENINLQNP